MTCPRRLRPRILGLSRCLAVPDLLETMPDSSGVLFTVLRYTFVAPDWKRAQVWIKSLRSGERKLLLENAVDARYANGYLVFSRQAKLYAVRFDLNNLSIIGSPVPVLDEVANSTVGNEIGRAHV